MKKIITISMCLMMMAAAVQVSAQNNDGPQQQREQMSLEDMAKQRADRMKEQLSLTDDQYAKVLELNKEQAKNMKPMSREDRENMSDEQREAFRDEMRKAREDYNAKVKEILTDEQYKKYEENSMNERGMRPGGGGNDGRNN